MPRAKKVTLYWSYPKGIYSAWESVDSVGQGIYQVTRAFGNSESLLYIGLVKGGDRNFFQRLNEHWNWLENTRGFVQIRFGKIVPTRGFTLTADILETIEGALILEYQPIWNVSKKNYYTVSQDLVIHNIGYRGFVDSVLDTRDHTA